MQRLDEMKTVAKAEMQQLLLKGKAIETLKVVSLSDDIQWDSYNYVVDFEWETNDGSQVSGSIGLEVDAKKCVFINLGLLAG